MKEIKYNTRVYIDRRNTQVMLEVTKTLCSKALNQFQKISS